MLDRLADLPVLALDAAGTIIAWNDLARALLGDWSALPVRQRNLAWQRFLGDHGRVALAEHEREQNEEQTVAGLRAAATKYPDDPGLRALVTELRTTSPRFAALWEQGRATRWRSHRKTIRHPSSGC